MMEEIFTTDLGKFGWREWEILRHILNAMCEKGLPEDFNQDGLIPMFNKNSGEVFLTNSDHQVCMLNGDALESYYVCPECGFEGFVADFEATDAGYGAKECCKEYLICEGA